MADIDTTRPHIGRIYDFMLGGHHNYEADRQAAAEILKVFPTYPKWARLNRWFLQWVANQWAEQGKTHLLDIASGLPTQGHFNEFLPAARILFSDIDPLSVSYGEEILKDVPGMRYIQADAAQPDALLAAASAFFGDERRLAVGCIGIAYLLPDEALRALAGKLHAWCAPGSVMAISYGSPVGAGAESSDVKETLAAFARRGGVQPVLRTPEQLAELVAPWRITASRPLEEWLEVPEILSPEEAAGLGGRMVGAFLER